MSADRTPRHAMPMSTARVTAHAWEAEHAADAEHAAATLKAMGIVARRPARRIRWSWADTLALVLVVAIGVAGIIFVLDGGAS